MFGRKTRLPTNSTFENIQVSTTAGKDTVEYLNDLKERIQTTQNIVKKHSEVAQQKEKYQFDKKAKASRITIGDQVLVKILAFEGKHKISNKFEEELYEVVYQPTPDIPILKSDQNQVLKRFCIRTIFYH